MIISEYVQCLPGTVGMSWSRI